MCAATRQPRLLAVSFAIAALALTACSNAGGVRAEGAALPLPEQEESQEHDGPAGSTPQGAREVRSMSTCTAADTEVVAAPVSGPHRHMLLTITNTGSKPCDLKGYPLLTFDGVRSVPPAGADTGPQAVISLPPGEKGYAGVVLSAGDGSGGEGYTAQRLEIGLQGSDTTAGTALRTRDVHVDDSLRVTRWLTTPGAALS
ncbi:DUF4232 domain-containing protein [Streptomyces sp. NPDC026206]|uniref:DUF4232 domain-containing protein n=1 Tax=Streptomyces sp. NPDC026206 TaxID=3157089 RepID=UPI0033F3738F